MAALIGLDIGDKRVGVAICSAGSFLAVPLTILERAQGRAEDAIVKLVTEHQAQTIVVGLPLDEAGNPTPQSKKIENFCRRLARRVDSKLVYVDEYASSEESREQLAQTRGRSALRARVDSYAATLILQSYLDSMGQAGER
ncbi:MAG: Holliday junction resolvase RuvX [Oligoflexia bacterium]|nr:Holliday junction resolvase RuvX [Oligoflexia bacterium]